jgi:hypothetical protein
LAFGGAGAAGLASFCGADGLAIEFCPSGCLFISPLSRSSKIDNKAN